MKNRNYILNRLAVFCLILWLAVGCKKDDIPAMSQITTYDQSLAGNWIPKEHKLYYFNDMNRPGADTTCIFNQDSIGKATGVYYNQTFYKLLTKVAVLVNNAVAMDTLKLKSDFTFSYGVSTPLTSANTKWYVVKNDDSRDSGLGQLKLGVLNATSGFWAYEKMYNIKEVSASKLVIEVVNSATEKVFYKIDRFNRVLMIDRYVKHTITYRKL